MEFYMLVLALDTTTRQGSMAIARDGETVATFVGDAAVTHGQRLPGDLLRLLTAHALRLADVEVYAVAAGPGSFTGLRIGIATMQGLAMGNRKPLVGVSALDAMYGAALPLAPRPLALAPADEVAVWMDAQRGQVFSATYSGGHIADAAAVEKPVEIVERWAREGRRPRVFAGDGALLHEEWIRRALPGAEIIEGVPPIAPSIAKLACAHISVHGPSSPDTIRPIYVRRSDAELARDRTDAPARP
jgi:tRNA threonylcarbamoyladenosine biosynthesis protein TsaB